MDQAPPCRGDRRGRLGLTVLPPARERRERAIALVHGARTDPAWEYLELPGSHRVMFSHPREVADIILA